MITPQQAISAPVTAELPAGPTMARAEMIGQAMPGAPVSQTDAVYDRYMKLSQLFAASDPAKAKSYQELAKTLKPTPEVVGEPYRTADGKTYQRTKTGGRIEVPAAEAPAVAKEYQRQLGTQMEYKGKQFYDPIVGRKTGTTGNTEIDDYLLSYLGDTGVIRKELLNAAKEMRLSNNPQALKEYQTLMSEFRKIRPDVTAANTGNLYKVDLPDEKIATMLDWDKPMSEQRNLIEKMRL
jgi:hypothetical protein